MDMMQTFKITGMHCVACTKITTKRIKEISGVKNVEVDLASETATIQANRHITPCEVTAMIVGNGYKAEACND
jgi:copper chaperone CopZ